MVLFRLALRFVGEFLLAESFVDVGQVVVGPPQQPLNMRCVSFGFQCLAERDGRSFQE